MRSRINVVLAEYDDVGTAYCVLYVTNYRETLPRQV